MAWSCCSELKTIIGAIINFALDLCTLNALLLIGVDLTLHSGTKHLGRD